MTRKERDARRSPRTAPATDHAPRKLFVQAGLILVLWTATLATLQRLVAPGPWFLQAVIIGVAALATACFFRVLMRGHALIASALGTLAALICWLAWQRVSGLLPQWFEAPGPMLRTALNAAATEVAPVAADVAFQGVLLLVAAVVASLLALIVVGAGAPVFAAVLLCLLMLVPSAITGETPSPALLAFAGAVLALTVWAASPRSTTGGLYAVVVSLAVAAAVVTVAPPTRDRVWNDSFIVAPIAASIPDVTITLAEDLRARSTTPAFDYTSSAGGIQRLALSTLVEFDDGRWMPDAQLSPAPVTVNHWRQVDSVTPSAESSAEGQEASDEVIFSVRGLLSEWLPLPQSALRAVADDEGTFNASRWLWTENAATARSPRDGTRSGQRYVAAASPLIAAEMDSPAASPRFADPDGAPQDLQRYLELPQPVPAAVSEAAGTVAGGLEDRWAVAQALQSWFRSGEFTYDEAAPYDPAADAGNPYSVIEALLVQRSGFCVHYASAFAILARDLGVPVRLAVGYATRSEAGERTTVTGEDLHAWPEVYFDDVGWVAFEPTPGGAGLRQGAADADAESVIEEMEEGSSDQDTPAADEPAEQTDQQEAADTNTTQTPGVNADAGQGHWWGAPALWWGLAGILLLLLPAGIRATRRLVRRLALALGQRSAERAWAELIDTSTDLGYVEWRSGRQDGQRAQTPEAVVEGLEAQGHLSGDAALAARQLAVALAAERYARVPGHGVDVGTELKTVVAGMRADVTGTQRAVAALAPKSLLAGVAAAARRLKPSTRYTRK